MSMETRVRDCPSDGQAEAWVARLLSPECTTQERGAFEGWLAESSGNVAAYLEVERVHALAAALSSDELLRAAARRARREACGNASRVRRRWVTGLSTIAATFALATVTYHWVAKAPAPSIQRYATVVGEQRVVTLADGTAMQLDTDTAVVARFDRERRVIEMEKGRVQLRVGQDVDRPFIVRAGDSTVHDIGTTFQVSRRGDEVNVGLIEGAVVVAVDEDGPSSRRSALSPGEQVTVDSAGVVQPKQALDVAVAEAWTRGDLVFKERRLDELVAEMNRYSRTQLRLADASLGGLTVSGVFHIGDQAALVAALERGWSLRSERASDNEVVLHGPQR